MKALLLSAGFGTRLSPLTDKIPKVMVPINKKPCIEYCIENLKKQGIKEFLINTHYLPEEIKKYFGNGKKFGIKINYSFEKQILGTAGSLNNFKTQLNETFLVVCADVLANFNIKKAINIHKKNKADITLFLDKKRSFKDKGLVIKEKNLVKMFVEKPQKKISKAYINSGFYIVEPSILSEIPPGFYDFGKDLFPKIINKKKICCVDHEGYIFDIGTLEDLKKAEEFLQKNL